jgi:hypothetical protein
MNPEQHRRYGSLIMAASHLREAAEFLAAASIEIGTDPDTRSEILACLDPEGTHCPGMLGAADRARKMAARVAAQAEEKENQKP